MDSILLISSLASSILHTTSSPKSENNSPNLSHSRFIFCRKPSSIFLHAFIDFVVIGIVNISGRR